MPTWLTGNRPSTKRTALLVGEKGFTLFELIIVVSVIALVSFLAAPAWQRHSKMTNLRGATLAFTTILRYAQIAAVTEGEERTVVVDFASGTYNLLPLVSPDDGSASKATNHWEVPRSLPSQVRFDILRPNGEDAAISAAELVFFPDGTAEPATLVVRSPAGEYEVVVEAATGTVQARRLQTGGDHVPR